MQHIQTPTGVTVSFDRHGSGPPLVLVHGSFSDHSSNWEPVRPLLMERFALYAVARRGRGETTATTGHSVPDEAEDLCAVIRSIPEPVYLLGHSYGAQVALAAAASVPERVRRLVLYEPPWPHTLAGSELARLERLAERADWDGLVWAFLRDTLQVPADELEALRATDFWASLLADAPASLGDLRALTRYDFQPERFRDLRIPVLLQVGSESPRELYITDAVAAVLPDARVEALAGQAHEGMTTAPELYAASVSRFLLE